MIRLSPLRSLWTRFVLAADHLAEQMAALTDPHGARQMVRVPAKAHSQPDRMYGQIHRQMRHRRMGQRVDRQA